MTSIAVKCNQGGTQEATVNHLREALRGVKGVVLQEVTILFPLHEDPVLYALFVVKVEGISVRALARLRETEGVEYAHVSAARHAS